MFKIIILFLLFSILIFPTHAQDIETKIVTQVNIDLDQAKRELEEIVNINSGSMNFEGVISVGRVLQKKLDELGFETEITDGSSFGRAGHLIASYGTVGPKILMIGHLDTVFSKEDNFQKYNNLEDNKVAGPGITDMKGGDIIIVSAVRVLKKLGLLNQVSIRIVMTGDEERSGAPLSASKQAIVDAAVWADIALGFEDGDGDIKTAVTSRRGSVGWTLDITGKPAHSSQIFQDSVGYGAIYEAARILECFRVELSSMESLTFNPGMIVGGTRINYDGIAAAGDAFGKNNVIAKELKVTGDIRALSIEQLELVKTKMQEIANNNLQHTTATLKFNEGYPPLAPTSGNKELLELYSGVSEDLGFGEVTSVIPRNAGAADISFTSGHVEMALDGLGLMGTGGHTKDEVADMTTLSKNIQKAAILIYRLSKRSIS
ncbi:MAG: M20/M25/M40 family metallo-hydrolase [Sphingomonadales bacterium]